MVDHDTDTDAAERRRQQAELYGEPLADLATSLRAHAGLEAPEIARTIGVSLPMFRAVLDGRRVRLGNPVAIARLAMLRDLAGHLASGVADPADTALALAQIAVAGAPPPDSGPTVVAAHRTGPPGAATHPPTVVRDTPRPGTLFSREGLDRARQRVAPHVQPSAALRWPLLERFTGTETWVKHENHNPTGAFKVRGGLNFAARLLEEFGPVPGLVSASRGNHSQSLAYAGRAHGVPVTIVVPEGNSPDKNAATEAYGAEVIVHGADFQEALEHAGRLGTERGLVAVPPFHPWLVEGVATYAAELHEAVPDLDVVYVPVGMGSGASANVTVRDLLGLRTEIVAVVADRAPAYALSFEAGTPVSTPAADTFVDGVACRTPDPDAVAILRGGVSRFVRVTEEQAAEAMALMFRCTHNLAEPAGSLALAGLLADRDAAAGRRVAVVHTGGNADFDVLDRALRERD